MKNKFDVYSNVPCKICGRLLKQNLVNKKPNADTCYRCFSKNKLMSTARQVKTGKKPGRKKGIYPQNNN